MYAVRSYYAVLPAKIRAVNVKAFNLGHRLAKKDWGDDAGEVWRVEEGFGED